MALVDHTEEGAGAPVLVVVPGRLDQVDYLQPNHVRPLQHPSLYAGDSHSAAVVTTAERRPTKSVSSKHVLRHIRRLQQLGGKRPHFVHGGTECRHGVASA